MTRSSPDMWLTKLTGLAAPKDRQNTIFDSASIARKRTPTAPVRGFSLAPFSATGLPDGDRGKRCQLQTSRTVIKIKRKCPDSWTWSHLSEKRPPYDTTVWHSASFLTLVVLILLAHGVLGGHPVDSHLQVRGTTSVKGNRTGL